MDGLLRDLLAEGLSLDAMAERLGCAPSTVSARLRRQGLEPNGARKHAPRGAVAPAALRPLIERGWSVAAIAAELGCSPDMVRRALKRNGLETRQARNRRVAREALAAGAARVELVCGRHGPAVHVLEGRGAFRCTRCRAEQVAEHRRRIKRTLIAEAGGSCRMCGYDRCEAALQFHHLDPAQKTFHLSLRGVTRALGEVRAEAAKCVLLCATCHAEVEAGFTTLAEFTLTPRGGLEPPRLD